MAHVRPAASTRLSPSRFPLPEFHTNTTAVFDHLNHEQCRLLLALFFLVVGIVVLVAFIRHEQRIVHAQLNLPNYPYGSRW